jgi:hypothetical protein
MAILYILVISSDETKLFAQRVSLLLNNLAMVFELEVSAERGCLHLDSVVLVVGCRLHDF